MHILKVQALWMWQITVAIDKAGSSEAAAMLLVASTTEQLWCRMPHDAEAL